MWSKHNLRHLLIIEYTVGKHDSVDNMLTVLARTIVMQLVSRRLQYSLGFKHNEIRVYGTGWTAEASGAVSDATQAV